jgi:hypothetical protein
MAALVAGSCIWRPSTRRSQTQSARLSARGVRSRTFPSRLKSRAARHCQSRCEVEQAPRPRKDVDDISTRTRPGTHVAPATLASRSCVGWQRSSPKAAPSGTSSAGVGRNHGAGARFPPVPCRTPDARPPARSNRSASRSADRMPAGVDCRSRPWAGWPVMRKVAPGTGTLTRKAEPVLTWQSVQWQTVVFSGSASPSTLM